MLITICGQTASGKDSIVRKLIEDYGYKRVISNTTRPMRTGEKDGVDYHFKNDIPFENTVCMKSYTTTQGVWHYWFNDDDIEEAVNSEDVYIAIADAEGAYELEEYGAKIIYIYARWEVRAERYMNRESRNENPDYKEVLRRLIADQRAFDKLEKEARSGQKYKILFNSNSELCHSVKYAHRLIESYRSESNE